MKFNIFSFLFINDQLAILIMFIIIALPIIQF